MSNDTTVQSLIPPNFEPAIIYLSDRKCCMNLIFNYTSVRSDISIEDNILLYHETISKF